MNEVTDSFLGRFAGSDPARIRTNGRAPRLASFPEIIQLAAVSLVVLLLSAVSVHAQSTLITVGGSDRYAGEFGVPINKSQILRTDTPIADILVGNPDIADVLALTNRSIYVLGKEIGSTSLTIYGENRKLIAVMDLVVSQDIQGLKARLFEILPEERIEVRSAGGAVVLSGIVSSSNQLSNALAVAEQFAPNSVTNLLAVEGSQQVMLAVRFAEVSRSTAKDLGINTQILDPSIPFTFTGLDLINFSAVAAATVGFSAGSLTVDFILDALEEKGVVKTLAEPNLIALSGDTASFLAGGEFPIPVAQSSDADEVTITIEFKEFGVSLAFTPTVLADGLINIIASPEVSAIDPTLSIVTEGLVIPGLKVRRATTTVELRDGESFAIAGLLQSDFEDTVRQIPFFGDIPIIGRLVSSSDFQRNETELVIIVTPHLVKPAPAGTLASPTDNFVPPADWELFLLGRTESRSSGIALNAQGAGGIEGDYGHIIK